MKNKILIIGDYTTRGADTCKWDGNLLNLTDYEIVIIDTSSLYKIWPILPGSNNTIKQWPGKIAANFTYINRKIIESILIDIRVYILFYPDATLSYSSDGWTYTNLNTNDWFPLSIKTQIENGTTVIPKNKSYQEYLDRLKSWKYYYLPKENKDDDKVKEFYKPNAIMVERRVIAANKLGKPLAMELVTSYEKVTDREYAEQNSRIILLPVTSEDTDLTPILVPPAS
jgi:hypothetical protein